MNKIKKIAVSISFLLGLTLQGCKCGDKEDIYGRYSTELKGIEVQDSTKGREVLRYLEMKSDDTFRLFDDESDIKISGTWSITACKTVEDNIGNEVPESTIEFLMENKKINGKFRGTSISFESPNDLYFGRYKSMLYLKLRDK